jgi:hypothetical protein
MNTASCTFYALTERVKVQSSEPVPAGSGTKTDIKQRVPAGYEFCCIRTALTTNMHLTI